MRIEWNVNPLLSHVVLETDADRELLLKNIKIEKYEWIFYYTERLLKEGKVEEALKELGKCDKYADMELDDPEVKRYESWLSDGHCGDCTCVPASCSQCIAESYVGLSTIESCGKHMLYKIQDAFDKAPKDIDKAIEILLDETVYDKKNEHWKNQSDEAWFACVPKWKAERKQAAEWLIAYKKENGF